MPTFDDLVKEAGLNRSQRQFCKRPANKNIRLLAPAGSGKTFSLLWRCKYIVQQAELKGDAAPHFLILAFTRSAKAELEYRIKTNSVFEDINATVRTLNSWGWEQIKRQGKDLVITKKQRQNLIAHNILALCQKYESIGAALNSGYSRNANATTIIDTIDLLKSLGFTHNMTKAAYKSQVRHLKETGLLPILEQGYEKILSMEKIGDDLKQREERISEFFNFWKKAVISLEQSNLYTLEDQKYWARMYFEKQIKEEKRPSGITRYTHVIVDEFQDVNPLDMELLKAACAYHGQKGKPIALTVIGDDDQAIFGWRGTTPKYILNPEKYFGIEFITCTLDTNYRSPKNIVEISNILLSYNKEREPKQMKSAAKGRALVKVFDKKKQLPSIDATMKLINTLMNDKRYQQIALIGRRQVSLFPYQVLLSAAGISYFVDADIDIFEGEAMQSLQNIIQTVYRAKDNDVDDPIESVLNICDKIDRLQIQKTERQNIAKFLDENDVSTFDECIDILKKYPKEIKKKNPHAIADIIKQLVEAETVYDFMGLVEKYLQGLDKDYRKKDVDTHYKEPQFFRLKIISKQYGTDFRGFNKDINRARLAGERSRKRSNDDGQEGYVRINETKIHLLTATRSKGHEYDAVIVLDADAEEWPNHMSEDIEEERRLFYVALSRARKYLCFVVDSDHVGSRFLLEAGLR